MDARLVAHVLREARPGSGERVLVAVINNHRDLEIARTEGWYRIPVKRAPSQVGADYLAFYLTGRFPPEQRHRVTYYAPIRAYRLARRVTLLPDEPDHPRAQDRYFKIEIDPLRELDPRNPLAANNLASIYLRDEAKAAQALNFAQLAVESDHEPTR